MIKPFKWLRNSPKVRLTSPLPPQKIVETYTNLTQRPRCTLIAYVGAAPFWRILAGKQAFFRKSVRQGHAGVAVFHGHIHDATAGSEIHGYFSMPVFAKLWMVLWLMPAIAISLSACMSFAQAMQSGRQEAIWGFAVTLAATVLFTAMALFKRVVRKKEETRTLHFFMDTFDAILVERRD
jgi:hypothetical protein